MDTTAGGNPFPHLRLVRASEGVAVALEALSDAHSPLASLQRIADENRRAARMAAGSSKSPTDDPLRLLAIRTAECLDGGRAAILRPERRRRLLRIAHMLGVGQFDANLVFAIVQDNARRGVPEAVAAHDPRFEVLAPQPRPAPTSPARWIVPQLIGALLLAALLLYAMVRWLGG